MGSPCWEVRRRDSLGRSVGEDDMGPQIEDPRLPSLHNPLVTSAWRLQLLTLESP